ncbi:hypothetical protein KQ302_00010 [Synechococcus sp. CS-602]|uniref:hypothetical protein n=1 Tax=Synechococcaceae TaxID=1890426 RepID=UPI000ADB0403|nr:MULTISPECIES: hypothetical protein [Synechococcaceae]MCT4363858.1 hypothetical protein [Candidatus Regnicoccus frigidus MAG-AL1]MCT0201640.1 hypothetical protein [Synechococcus sp. CS-603]MCT0203507.1 hypothetical protein [Synechococcus sp. CS-602]MCT0246269.1 hypothetical protein [Synechococcus sp. CS-601]MCT4366111.1 hypothetical protein [Candidatus Regnicoccus frigidus MAG-AL2]
MDQFHRASRDDRNDLQCTHQLTSLRDWCMERLSILSLQPDLEDARAMTREYQEMLMETSASSTLWMQVWRSR